MRLYLFIISQFFVGAYYCKQVEKHPDNVEFLNQNAVNHYSGTFKDIFFSEPDSTNNDTLLTSARNSDQFINYLKNNHLSNFQIDFGCPRLNFSLN